MRNQIRWVVLFALSGGMTSIFGQGDGLQDNIPFPRVPNTLLPCESQSQGWKLLHTTGSRATFDSNFARYINGNFTNTDLPTVWTYRAQDSSIYAQGGTPDIRSEFRGDDFDVRFSYRNDGNDGFFYKMLPRGGSAWDVAIEYAIENNLNAVQKQTAGAVFDMWPPVPSASQNLNSYASGKWNTVRVVSKNDSIEHWLNNRRVGRYRFWDANWNSAMANSKWSGSSQLAQNTPGCKCMVRNGFPIGFQGDHGGTWHIRDFRVKLTNITMGPVAPTGGNNPCVTTALNPSQKSAKLSYSLERRANAVRVTLQELAASRADLISTDGRLSGNVEMEGSGKTLLIKNWKRAGVHILRVYTHGRKEEFREKILLP